MIRTSWDPLGEKCCLRLPDQVSMTGFGVRVTQKIPSICGINGGILS